MCKPTKADTHTNKHKTHVNTLTLAQTLSHSEKPQEGLRFEARSGLAFQRPRTTSSTRFSPSSLHQSVTRPNAASSLTRGDPRGLRLCVAGDAGGWGVWLQTLRDTHLALSYRQQCLCGWSASYNFLRCVIEDWQIFWVNHTGNHQRLE